MQPENRVARAEASLPPPETHPAVVCDHAIKTVSPGTSANANRVVKNFRAACLHTLRTLLFKAIVPFSFRIESLIALARHFEATADDISQ